MFDKGVKYLKVFWDCLISIFCLILCIVFIYKVGIYILFALLIYASLAAMVFLFFFLIWFCAKLFVGF
jgi:hypothetical protein